MYSCETCLSVMLVMTAVHFSKHDFLHRGRQTLHISAGNNDLIFNTKSVSHYAKYFFYSQMNSVASFSQVQAVAAL